MKLELVSIIFGIANLRNVYIPYCGIPSLIHLLYVVHIGQMGEMLLCIAISSRFRLSIKLTFSRAIPLGSYLYYIFFLISYINMEVGALLLAVTPSL